MSKTVGVTLSLVDECSPRLKKVAEKLNLTEKQAKAVDTQVGKLAKRLNRDLGKAVKVVSAGCAAAVGAGVVLINKAVEAGDRIDKMSQKTQMSRKAFQEMDYVFSQNGANIEVMKVGMAKLTKTIDGARTGSKSNAATFKALGISLTDTSGKMKITESVMFEALAKLQKMPDGARKSALAMQLFGKSAMELAPLLNGNAKSVEELRKKYNDLRMGMTDEQIDAAVKFKDTMDSIQRAFGGLCDQIGGDLLPQLQIVADEFIKNIPQIKAALKPVIKDVCGVLVSLAKHFQAVTIVSSMFVSGLVAYKAVLGVIKLHQAYTAAVKGLTVAQIALNIASRLNPIGLWVTGIAVLIPLIVALIKNWDKVKEKIEAVTSKLNLFKKAAKNTDAKIRVEVDDKSARGAKKGLSGYASGTLYAHGGPALINEKGAELVELPEGSKVMTANATKQILGGGNYTINLNIAGNVIGNNEFIQQVSSALGRQLKTVMAC